MEAPLLTESQLLFILALAFWDLAWKGVALWHAAKNAQKGWFVALLLLNTAGLLPILYLMSFKKTHDTSR